MSDKIERPKVGEVETRRFEVAAEGRKIRGLVPYGIESRDMGGWREVIEPDALRQANLDELVARVDHAGVPIGRYPKTLELEDRTDGLHWAVIPPESRQDLREAIERGDLQAGSWQMVVDRERWDGDVRHVEAIRELRDVSVVSAPAYPAAAIEYRAAAPTTNPGDDRGEVNSDMSQEQVEERADAPEKAEERQEAPPEERAEPALKVEDRTSGPSSLTAEFRSRGFPGERAEITFDEFRAATIASGSNLDDLAPSRQPGVALGHDERFVYPVFPQVSVDAGTTSVDVVRQSSRTLASASNVIRDLAATTEKPETDSEVEIVAESLKQVASKQSGVPNVYLESQIVASIVENDLRLAVSEGLDKLVLDELAAADNVPPGTDPLLVSVRKGITAVQAEGYTPSVVILDPSDAEALDVLVAESGTEHYVFGPGSPAPGTLFGLQVRVSKSTPSPIVADAAAVGRLYTSPVSLQRFEESDGATNSSLIRLELHALFGVERLDAAVRIAPND